ncbi:MAG: 16S rRNA (uracil(1498)-N(3))-methyltransferase, partial [Thermotogae bacterium]
CVLNEIKKDRSTATIKKSKRIEEIPAEAEHTLCIASQGWGRLRWIVEKSVELGVDRLIIYKSVRSRSYKDKYNKVQLIVRDSAKQCERYAFPEVLFFEDFSFLNILKGNTVVLHKSGRPAELKDFKGRVNLIVGPEGDFTQEEADMLAENGTPISFGRKILRFETAAILSVGLVAFLNGKI